MFTRQATTVVTEAQQQEKPRHYGFSMVPRLVMRHERFATLTESAKWLYTCLKDICGESEKGECFYTLRKLGDLIHMSASTISRGIGKLVEAGLILIQKIGKKHQEIYHIRMVDIWQENDALYESCFKMKQVESTVSNRNSSLAQLFQNETDLFHFETATDSPQAQSCFNLTYRGGRGLLGENLFRGDITDANASDAHADLPSYEKGYEGVRIRTDSDTPFTVEHVIEISLAELEAITERLALRALASATPPGLRATEIPPTMAQESTEQAPQAPLSTPVEQLSTTGVESPTKRARGKKALPSLLDTTSIPCPEKPSETDPWNPLTCLKLADYYREHPLPTSERKDSPYQKAVEVAIALVNQQRMSYSQVDAVYRYMLCLDKLADGTGIYDAWWDGKKVDLWHVREHCKTKLREIERKQKEAQQPKSNGTSTKAEELVEWAGRMMPKSEAWELGYTDFSRYVGNSYEDLQALLERAPAVEALLAARKAGIPA